MWLFLAFLSVPLIEIGLFIEVGGLIGLWPTLAIVVFTAVLGSWLMRAQGLMALGELRGSIANMQDPSGPLAHGALILFAGALLLTPGFFTDSVGLALLIPPFRAAFIRFLAKRVQVQGFQMHGAPRRDTRDDVIDGEYEVDPDGPNDGPPKHLH